MDNQTNFYGKDNKDSSYFFRTFSWGGIVGAALVSVGLSFLLNLFSMAVGLSAFTVTTQGLLTLGVGGFIGMLIGIIIVMFLSGLVAGYGAKACGHRSSGGALHGLISWCLSLLITIIFATAVGNFMTNNFYALAKGSQGLIELSQNEGNQPITPATHAAQESLQGYGSKNHSPTMQNENSDTATTDSQAADNTGKSEATQNPATNDNSQPNMTNATADLNSSLNNAGEKAMKATHTAGGVTFAMFILFLIAALASMCGGYFGTQSKRESAQ